MRIVFAGSGTFGLPSLKALVEGGHEVVLIVTQPDRPAGRGQVVRAGPIKWFARQWNIPVLQPEDINTAGPVRRIRNLKADLLLVIAFGQKIGPAMLAVPRYGAVNLHASLLPEYRGAAPVNWALINGELETGLTVISMTGQIDAGDILGQRATPIEQGETAGELLERLSLLGARLVAEVVREILLGEVERRRQNDNQATLAPRLKKSDGRINWDLPAQAVFSRIRGTTPWPGAYTALALAGKAPLRIVVDRAALVLAGKAPLHIVSDRAALALAGKAPLRIVSDRAALAQTQAKPGEILACGPDGIEVAAAKGAVRILQLTPAGKHTISAAEFVNGYRVKPGARFLGAGDPMDGGRD